MQMFDLVQIALLNLERVEPKANSFKIIVIEQTKQISATYRSTKRRKTDENVHIVKYLKPKCCRQKINDD